MKSYTHYRGDSRYQEGNFDKARKTGPVSPNAHGKTAMVGKTRDMTPGSANGMCRVAAITQSKVKGANAHRY